MVCDEVRGILVMFGGSSYDSTGYQRDTWSFAPGMRGSYVTYGAGCAGTGGTPTLGAGFGASPVAGQGFSVQVTGLPLLGSAFLFVGASRTQWGLFSLPLDLSPIGMSACTLFASGEFMLPVTNVLGSGLCSFTIPVTLAGQRFFNQAIALDAAANGAGLTTSNGAEAVVGQ